MYLLVIQVPFERVSQDVALVASDWACALRLLRDSMEGRHGHIVVAAPQLPIDFAWREQKSVTMDAVQEDIRFVGLCEANLRAMRFWKQARKVYRHCLELANQAEVVHAGMSDLFRPISQLGWIAAIQTNTPIVFVEDTDSASQIRQLAVGKKQVRTSLYCHLYDKVMKYAVAHADVSLLKGKNLYHRFRPYAKNAKCFHNTSYDAKWVIAEQQLHEKTSRLASATKLRCVYLGRLVARKGVDDSLRFIAELRQMGCDAYLDIIGGGSEEQSLKALSAALGLSEYIKFRGLQTYNENLLSDLRQYDLQIQTPPAEDTPRSVFDGFAAGLPLACYQIDYLDSLITSERCGVTAPIGKFDVLAKEVMALWSDRQKFVDKVIAARATGLRHSANKWYRKRDDWLQSAMQLRQGVITEIVGATNQEAIMSLDTELTIETIAPNERGICCPDCHAPLIDKANQIYCDACANAWPILDGVPDFTCSDRRAEEEMFETYDAALPEMVRVCEKDGWFAAMTKVLRPLPGVGEALFAYAVDESKGDLVFAMDIHKGHAALDLGCGLGAVSVALAERGAKLFVMDISRKQVEFTVHRCRQMGYEDVQPIAGGDDMIIPLADQSLNAVVMNGVIEWVGCANRFTGTPEEAQRAILREVYRVLKPGGQLYISSKNRLALIHWLGSRPDHVTKLPWVGMLSPLMQRILTFGSKQDCGARLHSLGGFRKLFREIRFEIKHEYALLPNFRSPKQIIPLEHYSQSLYHVSRDDLNRRLEAILSRWMPAWLMRRLMFSYGFVLEKK